MAETANLGLPLLAPSQAQKHVTVNEALARLDALAKGVVVSRTASTPPEGAAEGAVWIVPAGAQDEWAGRDGMLAIALGGGWDYARPREGWRAYLLDEGAALRHDGAGWVGEATFGEAMAAGPGAPSDGPVAVSSPGGASTIIEVIEFDQAIGAGVNFDTEPVIPRRSIVLGVTGRVIEEITGTLTQWTLGNPGASDRFGKRLGTEVGSHVEGVLSRPTTFYPPEPLRFTAMDGSFAGGKVRIAIHLLRLTPPSA